MQYVAARLVCQGVHTAAIPCTSGPHLEHLSNPQLRECPAYLLRRADKRRRGNIDENIASHFHGDLLSLMSMTDRFDLKENSGAT